MTQEAKKKEKLVSLEDAEGKIDREIGGDLNNDKAEWNDSGEEQVPVTDSADSAADPAYVYFKDLGRFKILSREKEVEIARRIERSIGDHHLHRHTAARDWRVEFVRERYSNSRAARENARAA